MKRILLSLVVLLLASGAEQRSIAQPSTEYSSAAERTFQAALRAFEMGMFTDAASGFGTIISEYPTSQRITAAYVMRGKSLVAGRDYLGAAKVLRAFLDLFPGSTYVPDAHETLGEVYWRIGRADEAVAEFRAAWRTLPSPVPQRLRQSIVSSLDSLLARAGTPDVERLLAGSGLQEERAFFWILIAEKEAADQNIVAARVAVDSVLERYPNQPFAARVAVVEGMLSGATDVKLAVLLPFMRSAPPSATKELANDIADGIQFAVERYSSDPKAPIRVTLETRDTERNAETAGRVVRDLARDRGIVAIIGPAFSTTAATAAAVAQTEGVPLISPTANSNGIAAAGPYAFQANPDYRMRGRAAARYAVLAKGCTVLATLAPSDTYSKFLAEGFIREAEALGARVIAKEEYLHGSTDLKSQFSNIRKSAMSESAEPLLSFQKLRTGDQMALLQRGIPKKRIDSLLASGGVVKATDIFGPHAKAVLDSMGISPEYDLSRLDSVEYPATGLQAIYIPIASAQEIGVVSAQLIYFNIPAQLFGSGEWNDLAELDEHKSYCTGLIFESDTYIDTSSTAYHEFVSGYRTRFQKSPSRNAFFGYDTADLVLAQIRRGAATRQGLARALAAVGAYQGLHSRIGFGEDRVNFWLNILQYDGSGVRRLDEIPLE